MLRANAFWTLSPPSPAFCPEKKNPGNNSNDSMGEYYYNEKDYENSLKYYRKSLDHFRYSISGTDKVRELDYLLKK